MQLGGQRDAQATLSPGRAPSGNCTGRWMGSKGGLDGCGEELLLPPRFEPRTVQPVASHYTACTTPASNLSCMLLS